MPFYCCALLAKSAEAFSLSRVECEGGRATGAMLFYCIRPVCEIPPKHSAYRALNAKADELQGRCCFTVFALFAKSRRNIQPIAR